jgi:glycosyltransferase involved in cell wall biosynthesis
VTVGMPVYNGEQWLRPAVDSILEQTYRDLELVVSDNASTDTSLQIARDYAERDERVRVVQNSVNVGVDRNYSLLVDHARGEYFKWASANDLCDHRLIERCVAALDAHPEAGVCYTRTRLFVDSPDAGEEYDDGVATDDDDPVTRFRYVLERTRLNNAINGLIRMSALRGTSLMASYYSSDVVLLGELALRGKILELPEYLFFRRFSPDSATSLQDSVKVREVHFPRSSRGRLFQAWRRCRGYVTAVTGATLTPRQRARALVYVARLCYWTWPDLYADLKEAAAEASRRPSAIHH